MAYRYKLLPGIRYRLATLTIPLTAARRVLKVLNHENFHSLSFLGVNRNVKREWRTIHRAFGGIGLFSFAAEHTISMINIFIQHYGARTMLANNFMASIKALQLELKCKGNSLRVNYDKMHILATECWMKSFWERLHYYRFKIHLAYPPLTPPCQYKCLLVAMF
jgi:hypothetical protein